MRERGKRMTPTAMVGMPSPLRYGCALHQTFDWPDSRCAIALVLPRRPSREVGRLGEPIPTNDRLTSFPRTSGCLKWPAFGSHLFCTFCLVVASEKQNVPDPNLLPFGQNLCLHLPFPYVPPRTVDSLPAENVDPKSPGHPMNHPATAMSFLRHPTWWTSVTMLLLLGGALAPLRGTDAPTQTKDSTTKGGTLPADRMISGALLLSSSCLLAAEARQSHRALPDTALRSLFLVPTPPNP